MFDQLKKIKQFEELGKKAGELLKVTGDLLAELKEIDENGNGIPDGVEILQELQRVPALVAKEAGDVVEEVEEARAELRKVYQKLLTLAGSDVGAIKLKAAKQIDHIQKLIPDLKKRVEELQK